jgi:hypothetical protein
MAADESLGPARNRGNLPNYCSDERGGKGEMRALNIKLVILEHLLLKCFSIIS